jgi:hypothetical protein
MHLKPSRVYSKLDETKGSKNEAFFLLKGFITIILKSNGFSGDFFFGRFFSDCAGFLEDFSLKVTESC